jgi:hypothetical protein
MAVPRFDGGTSHDNMDRQLIEGPTVFAVNIKSRLSQKESYPLSAKDISDALGGLSQGELLISFYRTRDHGTKGMLLNVGCWRKADKVEWNIFVYSVARTLRHELRTLLRAKALPVLRSWLVKNKKPVPSVTALRLQVFYDAAIGSLDFHEFLSN